MVAGRPPGCRVTTGWQLPPVTADNQWTCRLCGHEYVVAALARDCEARHVALTDEEERR